jgi:hypothetical protein
MPRDYTGGQGPARRTDVPDPGFAGIPGPAPANDCPDCGCHAHWKNECRVCGCPDGPTRKRQRDAEQVAGHGPGEGRPVTGFA